jgi:hypothetical protein
MVCFLVAGTHDVQVFGWVDKVSNTYKIDITVKCDMSANWTWFTFLNSMYKPVEIT